MVENARRMFLLIAFMVIGSVLLLWLPERPIKLVVPVTDWKPAFVPNIWHVRSDPDPTNGLTKVSAIDVLQARGMDTQRFLQRLGEVTPEMLEEILLAIAAVIEYP